MGPAGPALAGDLDPEARDEALEFAHGVVANLLLETKATTARMILPPLAPRARETWNDAENPLLRYGYADDSTLTSVVDLRGSEEAIFGSFCRAYRNRIRKAEKDGVVVEPIADRSEIDVYYALHVETYERTGVKPHPKAYFEAIYDLMASRGLCEILFAKRDGRAIAAINVATFGDASLYWTGANGAAGLELGAAKLLHWTAMKRAKARGVVLYETGEVFPEAASGTKHAGLTDFKGRFGGAVVPFRKGVMAAGAAARTRR
jgi:lipid II:glycine glycyltransferase (peptidoglycan interpeptide bridge formation enzyme)